MIDGEKVAGRVENGLTTRRNVIRLVLNGKGNDGGAL